MKTPDKVSPWVKAPVANLGRCVPSGAYFARVRVGGKLIHRSLKTDKISVAQLRLVDLVKDEREKREARAEAISSAGAWCSRDCAALVCCLAYGGFRKGEAAAITWADCDFERGEMLVRGDATTGTKNWTVRRVPIIPDMRALLDRLRKERSTSCRLPR